MTRERKPPLVVVEAREGVVQDVYSDVKGLRVILVDWDRIEAGDGKVIDYEASSLRDMSNELREKVSKALKEDHP